ncbi:hypothetical protein [Microcoleus sp. FACHB-68]|uniref:hypothetical protein n=1 Tax=Microcoleus sp. FACHB-68 TaxID=2692826 RepID=UPI001684BB39|nr:hypothetical protein [Microcoleus sp. FACHB-68]MBD1938011.1 hypothetical protein [Microcoleus sp. FACHB-68]
MLSIFLNNKWPVLTGLGRTANGYFCSPAPPAGPTELNAFLTAMIFNYKKITQA